MATEPDPYRTLGLPRTASLAEVKAAYRRLAKANHPDAAGEAALPRFLAIQAAYERLVGPTTGRPRSTSSPTPGPAPRQPWEAEPDRSDATHRAYGGRARRPPGSTSRKAGSRPKSGESTGGATSGTSQRARPTGDTGPSGGSGRTDASGRTGAGGANRNDPKKATLGSTSYDEADREAFEPDWVGASWYGQSSGTYWTINPKEYADPRKHGPEYQARARRARQTGKDPDAGIAAGPAGSTDAANSSGSATSAANAADAGDATPRHTTSSWWDATSGPDAPAGGDGGSARPQPAPPRSAPRPRPAPAPRSAPTSTPGPIDASPGMGLADIGRALIQGRPPSIGWRIARAVIGWLPIALAIGWATGEVSGCARYAATCDDGIQPIAWAAQAIALAALLVWPVIAGWATIAAIVSLVVAVPTTLFITANAGGEASTVGPGFLGVVLGLAWVIGILGAIALGRRQPLGPTGPVS